MLSAYDETQGFQEEWHHKDPEEHEWRHKSIRRVFDDIINRGVW